MEYKLTAHDLESIGELTRENAEQWLMTHSGDFQSIKDFRVDIGEFESDWSDPESEPTYNDCMFPADD
jgi:hypothetical protein